MVTVDRADLQAAERRRELVLAAMVDVWLGGDDRVGAGLSEYDVARFLDPNADLSSRRGTAGRIVYPPEVADRLRAADQVARQLASLGWIERHPRTLGSHQGTTYVPTTAGIEQIRRLRRGRLQALVEDWRPELKAGLISLLVAVLTAVTVSLALQSPPSP